MKESDRYLKIVEWSEEDQKYIGSCPELFSGGCHGDNEVKVYKELCEIVDEVVQLMKEDGDPFPEPKRQYCIDILRAQDGKTQAAVGVAEECGIYNIENNPTRVNA